MDYLEKRGNFPSPIQTLLSQEERWYGLGIEQQLNEVRNVLEIFFQCLYQHFSGEEKIGIHFFYDHHLRKMREKGLKTGGYGVNKGTRSFDYYRFEEAFIRAKLFHFLSHNASFLSRTSFFLFKEKDVSNLGESIITDKAYPTGVRTKINTRYLVDDLYLPNSMPFIPIATKDAGIAQLRSYSESNFSQRRAQEIQDSERSFRIQHGIGLEIAPYPDSIHLYSVVRMLESLGIWIEQNSTHC